jgi:prolyl oligopeptidase
MEHRYTSAMPLQSISYPNARREDFSEVLHGVEIADPYRWMEDIDSKEVADWIQAENELTSSLLSAVPEREEIHARLSQLWNFERYGIPQKAGSRYFFSRNSGLQNQSPVYVADSLEDEPRLLLDPNTLSEDGTVALNSISVSPDGNLLAYAIASGGSDWQEWHVRDVRTGEDYPNDILKWSKFSGAAWLEDSSGFFYSRYDEPTDLALKQANYFQKLYFHPVGFPQTSDTLVYDRPDQKEWGFSGEVSEDGQYLVISVWQGTLPENRVFVKRLSDPTAPVIELLTKQDGTYGYIGNDGETFYFLTDRLAPLRRVIAVELDRPEEEFWRTIVPEGDATIRGVSLFGDRLIVSRLRDSHSAIELHGLDGSAQGEVELPGIGSAGGFGGRRDHGETFFAFTAFTAPTTIYRYDIVANKVELFRKPVVDFDADAYVTEQVFFPSKDGTRIPLFLTYRKGLERSGDHPTLMTGYGGFNMPTTPYFSIANSVWLERGGVLAVVVLRGGGDYGKPWHDAGRLLNKQNVFDDFIAAGEYLFAEGFTNPKRLAIKGGSNGGLLVGAVLTQRPDMFGAALPGVGVLDMLRFDKFTIGWAWKSDYGDPAVAEDFAYLRGYSPYHNLRNGTSYPATLITTGDHDDRVYPAHSFKFAAAIQRAQGGDAPVLIRVETRGGHGAGKPVSKVIDEIADEWTFLTQALR